MRTSPIIAVALTTVLVLAVAPAHADEALDQAADAVDEQVTAAQCQVFFEVWSGVDDCLFDPNAEFTCVVSGRTVAVRPGTEGLAYALGGELDCREDGRTLRTLHGTFKTGKGTVTRTCTNAWCEKRGGVYDAYALTDYQPRCVYRFTGPGGPGSGQAQTLHVELPGAHASFSVEDFKVANGDGLPGTYAGSRATTEFWVLDDGDPSNGYSEGVAELSVTMDETGARSASGATSNCLSTDRLSGFSVQGTLHFAISEESVFRASQ